MPPNKALQLVDELAYARPPAAERGYVCTDTASNVGDDFLERVWASREERVYPELFGTLKYSPSMARPFEVFKQEPDPRWLFTGVVALASLGLLR